MASIKNWIVFGVKWVIILMLASWFLLISPIQTQNLQNLGGSKKGLALTGSKVEDVEALNASWFYVYSVSTSYLSNPGYVPMFGDGTPDGNLPNDYDGFVLVFNEPFGVPPYGIDISAEEGAQRWLMLLDLYENAKFVVGGVVNASTNWVGEFLSYLEEDEYPEYWHVHHYLYDPDSLEWAIGNIRDFHDFVNAPIWVTEFGSITADQDLTRRFMFFLETTDWIEHYAYFPTRIPEVSGMTPPWWPSHWNLDMALIEWESGEITGMGETFRDFSVKSYYLPIVAK